MVAVRKLYLFQECILTHTESVFSSNIRMFNKHTFKTTKVKLHIKKKKKRKWKYLFVFLLFNLFWSKKDTFMYNKIFLSHPNA